MYKWTKKPSKVVEFARDDEKYKDPFSPIKGMAISAGITGAAVGGLGSAFYMKNKWPQIVKHTAVGGALGALAGGGGAYIGTKILGTPAKSESTAYAKRTALGGAIGGAAVAGGGAILLKHGKFKVPFLGSPREYLEKYAHPETGYRPLKFIKEKSTPVGAGVSALVGGLAGGFHGLDEGFQGDFIRNEQLRKQRNENRKRNMASRVKPIAFAKGEAYLTPEEEAGITNKSKKQVALDRYQKAVIEREAHRRNVDYAISAGAGALLGRVVAPKARLGRTLAAGAAAGLGAQFAVRTATSGQRDKFGERSIWARRFDRAPWIGAGVVSAGVLGHRFVERHPTVKAFLKKHFSARENLIRFEKLTEEQKNKRWMMGGIAAAGTGAAIGIRDIGGRHLKEGEVIRPGQRVACRHAMGLVHHEGIAVGNNRILSMQPPANRLFGKATFKIESLKDFTQGRHVKVLDEYPDPHAAMRALDLKKKLEKQGTAHYDILYRNCQNFAGHAKFGGPHAGQSLSTKMGRIFPRELKRGLAGASIGSTLVAGAYVANKELGKRKEMSALNNIIQFKKKEEHEPMTTGRKLAIAGGVGGAAVGASMLPAFGHFAKIGYRMQKKEYLEKQSGSNANKWLPATKAPKRDPNFGGKMVADYLEGAHAALGKGIHGRVIGVGLRHGMAHPEGALSKGLGGPFQVSHFARFRSDPTDAISHWDWEYGLHHEKKAATQVEENMKTHGVDKATAEKMSPLHQSLPKKQAQMAVQRQAFWDEVNHHKWDKGLNSREAILHVARNTENPHVQGYLNKLAASKTGAAKGYVKKSLLAPALVIGGLGAAGLGIAGTAYATRPKIKYGDITVGNEKRSK
jgi:hypothetical protein